MSHRQLERGFKDAAPRDATRTTNLERRRRTTTDESDADGARAIRGERGRESVDYRAFKRSSSDLDDDGCADSAQFAKATCLNVKGASMSKMPSHCTTLSGELNT